MKSRIYQIGDVTLATGEKPQVFVSGKTLPDPPNKEDKLRSPDFLVLQYLITEAGKVKKSRSRTFTNEELAKAGWPDKTKDKNNNIQTQIALVPSTFTRLRHNFPGILPGEGRWLNGEVIDVTPIDQPLLVAHRIFIGCTITAVPVVLLDTAVRAVMSANDLTLTQPNFADVAKAMPHQAQHLHAFGFVLGVFQGILGSILYSLPISVSLLCFWFVLYRFDPWRARFPRTLAALVGSAGGAVGGFAISVALLYAQHIDTLHAAKWVPENSDRAWDAFTISHYAYAMPIFGLFVGAAVGSTVLWVVSRPSWRKFLLEHTSVTTPRVALDVLLGVAKLAIPWSLAFVSIALALASAVICIVLVGPVPIARVIGEAIVILAGGVAFIAGTLAAIYSLTKGADIAADEKCSLIP